MNKIVYVTRLLRMKQWVKNTFIFFPLLFSGRAVDRESVLSTLITFIGFSLVASSVYILNDLLDIEKDRLHPKKSQRPLCQGPVNKPLIIAVMFSVMFVGFFICSLANPLVLYCVAAYVFTHLIYNFYAKRIVILDVIFVAIGFQIRIWAGSVASGVFPSVWLQMCVFILALFLGFTKRRYEISTLRDKASEHRSVLAHYTSYLLDQIIIICSTLAIVFYGLYTISSDIVDRIGSHHMVYSVAFVIYGIFRYLYLVHVKKAGDEPGEILLTDAPLITGVLLWIIYISFLIYF